MRRSLFRTLGGVAAAALGLTALLYAVGYALRPDVTTPPPPPPADQLAAVEAARRAADRLDVAHAPVLYRSVDYSEGSRGAWWPKGEAPVLAALVRAGRLPPVAERTGPEPVVIEGMDGIGRYGGSWYRLTNAHFDLSTIYWRLSASNLVRWSPQGYPIVPHVAKSWEISPDYRVFTFTLRRGMRWSDGYPVTSNDIVYWYEDEVKYFKAEPRLLHTAHGRGRVEKIDDLHVRFVFDEPNPLFLERLASTPQNPEDYTEYIVPEHYLRPYHPALGDPKLIRATMVALRLSSPLAVYQRMKDYLNPCHPRLWPWVYHTYAPITPQTFVRNPYYFAVDPAGNQLPYLDRMVIDVKPNDLIALSAADGELSMQDRFVRYEDYSLLMDNARRNGYQVYHWKSATQSVFTIFPNLNRRVDPARPETRWKHLLLNDRRFRQALSLAINRQSIIDAEFNDQTRPAQIEPGADSPYHDERLAQAFIAYDPATANRLLDQLGLAHRDADGYRTYPDGSRMTFVLNITDFTIFGPTQFVVDDWDAVGVRTVIRERARKFFDIEKYTLEHDFTVWTGESEFYPLVEPRSFVPVYRETYYAPGFGVWYQNGGLYGDPAAQRPNAIAPPLGHPLRRAMEILDQARSLTTESARRERVHELLEIAADNLWTISICTPPPQLVVVKNGFRNVPRVALYGACFLSPGNTGIETYFWDHPSDPPDVVARTQAAILHITPPPDSLGSAGTGWLGRTLRWLFGLGTVCGLALVGFRHPFIGRRLLLMIPTMLVVSVIVFTLVQLPPGDYVETNIMRLEMQGTPSDDQMAAELRRTFHLDESVARRYARWLGLDWFVTFQPGDAGLLQGDLGISMEYEKSVNQIIGDRLLLTVIVTLATVVFTWALALPAGIYSAVRPHSPGDMALTFICFLGLSVPSFLLALIILYLGKRWFNLNLDGLFSPEYALVRDWSWGKVGDLLKHLWVPVVALGFGGIASMMRLMRANLLDELPKPYVVTARAKGLRPLRLLLKYPVRVALNPFISGLGHLFPMLVSGGTIVAIVLSLPMLGPTMLDALLAEDIYFAGSMLMLLSLLGMVGTLVSDLLLLWLDPRIQMERDGR